MEKYSLNIVWSDEDRGYVATIPELKNLSAFGETYEEALKEATIAAEGYLETLREENLAPPAACKLSEYSGQIRLRMPRDLHQKLTVESERQGVSLNTYMISLLSMNYGFCKWLEVPPIGETQILYFRSTSPSTDDVIKGKPQFNFTAYPQGEERDIDFNSKGGRIQ